MQGARPQGRFEASPSNTHTCPWESGGKPVVFCIIGTCSVEQKWAQGAPYQTRVSRSHDKSFFIIREGLDTCWFTIDLQSFDHFHFHVTRSPFSSALVSLILVPEKSGAKTVSMLRTGPWSDTPGVQEMGVYYAYHYRGRVS